MTDENVDQQREELGEESARKRLLPAQILRFTPRVFAVIGLASLVWSLYRSWMTGAFASIMFTILMAAFGYSIEHHFEADWFQKSMIRVMWITFGFLALCALFASGVLGLARILGI